MKECTPYEALHFVIDQLNADIGIREQDYRLHIQTNFRGYLFNDGQAVMVNTELRWFILNAREQLLLGARLW